MGLFDTFICPSIPVAAATIPVPPLGSLANSFVAYALRILWNTWWYKVEKTSILYKLYYIYIYKCTNLCLTCHLRELLIYSLLQILRIIYISISIILVKITATSTHVHTSTHAYYMMAVVILIVHAKRLQNERL